MPRHGEWHVRFHDAARAELVNEVLYYAAPVEIALCRITDFAHIEFRIDFGRPGKPNILVRPE